jgi:hypothetical protein
VSVAERQAISALGQLRELVARRAELEDWIREAVEECRRADVDGFAIASALGMSRPTFYRQYPARRPSATTAVDA